MTRAAAPPPLARRRLTVSSSPALPRTTILDRRRRESTTPLRSAATASARSGGQSENATGAAWKTLRDFSAAEFRKQARPWTDTAEKRAALRAALMDVYRSPAPADSGYGWPGAGGDAAAPASPPPPGTDVIVGVTASDARLAVRALREWCAVLGLPYVQPEVRLGPRGGGAGGAANANTAAATPSSSSLAALPPGPVYVKYAPAGGVCYASPYAGPDRGVLLQLGQAPLLGHFPLGLAGEGGAAVV
jgi:hypothetical protein